MGRFVAWAFTLRRYGYRTEFERGPFVVAVTAVFGILFLVAGLLEPFNEHRRNSPDARPWFTIRTSLWLKLVVAAFLGDWRGKTSVMSFGFFRRLLAGCIRVRSKMHGTGRRIQGVGLIVGIRPC